MRLANHNSIILGGASGMGAATAELFAEQGATVVIADLNLEGAQEIASRCGDRALAVSVDMCDRNSVQAMVATAHEHLGCIDNLVNTVGYAKFCPTVEVDEAELMRNLQINLTVFWACQSVGKHMIEQRYGKIVNFASTAGFAGVPGMAAYTAAKHGVVGLTRALAVEWGQFSINVNCVCPGSTTTPMLMGCTDDQWREERAARIPLARLATPKDQANAALFLASDEASYLTGCLLTTDGGINALASGTSDHALRYQ